MALTGCTMCIKYMLFFFNFIFWLAGGVILGVALWLRHDSQTSNLLILQFEGKQAPGTFYTSVYILIAVGAVMMLVGFVGCYGAIQESQCLLGTFFFFLVILFACEVAAAIWGFMNRDTISKELINFYDSAYINALDVSGSSSKDSAIKVLHVFHNTLECCGKGDDTALFKQVASTLCPQKSTADLLKSQEDPLNPLSCHKKLSELFSQKLYLIGLAALVVAVIMIFEMIFTMVLCCGIRNSPVY
ncbi:CD81 antigen-like [Thalassophryne amazonica]|uniref:CD81 antigen-like n=1 Tax=Thalassophryne amazonica TaxID=390379 RepID=UPI001470BCBD|nr:CD81 antigen-like [Thalassophryne amazonica]